MNIVIKNTDENEIYKNNLIVNENLLILWNDYDNFKTKLENYNAAIEVLTLEVLQLSLSNHKDRNAKKIFSTKNNLKITLQNINEENIENELLLTHQLLLIKLRSLQLEQCLYEENSDLKKLIEKSNQFLINQKQQLIKKINPQKTETCFAARFKLLLNTLHNITNIIRSKSYLNTGYQNYSNQQCYDKEISVIQQNNFEFLNTFDIIKYSNNKLDYPKKSLKLNKIYKEILSSYILSNNLFHNNSNLLLQAFLFNRNIKELSLFFELKKEGFIQIESLIDNTTNITKENKRNSKCTHAITKFNLQSIENRKMNDSDAKENVVCINPSKIIKCESKFQKIKNILTTASEVIRLQSEKINFYSFVIQNENTKENFLQNIYLDLYQYNYNKNSNNIKKYINKVEIPYNLEKINEISTNYNELKSEILNSYLRTIQYNTNEKNITVGIGENSALLFDQETQIDNYYLKDMSDTNNKKTESFTKEIQPLKFDEMIVNRKIKPVSNNFKETLQSLKETMQQCYDMSEEEPILPLSKKLNTKSLIVSSNKNTLIEKKKRKRNLFDTYNKNNDTFTKMPEMSKIYQIVLQNKVPEGINFEFIKSNEKIFIIHSSSKTSYTS